MSGRERSADIPEAPTIIRGACILSMIVGAVSVMFSLPLMLDASNGRCQLSRSYIEQANKDKKDWNNVDIGSQKAKDVPCPDAVRLARQIPRNEKGTQKVRVPSESALKTQNTVAAVMGGGQAVSGFYLIRSLGRMARNATLGFSAAGVVLQVLGILSLGSFAFIVYALTFSPASREIWPREARRG